MTVQDSRFRVGIFCPRGADPLTITLLLLLGTVCRAVNSSDRNDDWGDDDETVEWIPELDEEPNEYDDRGVEYVEGVWGTGARGAPPPSRLPRKKPRRREFWIERRAADESAGVFCGVGVVAGNAREAAGVR